MKSDFLSLKTKDFLKGLIMAVLMPVLVLIQQSIDAGTLTFNWKPLAMAAVAGLVGYLIKNFFTDSVAEAKQTIADARTKEMKQV